MRVEVSCTHLHKVQYTLDAEIDKRGCELFISHLGKPLRGNLWGFENYG